MDPYLIELEFHIYDQYERLKSNQNTEEFDVSPEAFSYQMKQQFGVNLSELNKDEWEEIK